MRSNKRDEVSSYGLYHLSRRTALSRQTQLPLGTSLLSLNLLESPVVEWSLHSPGGGGLGAICGGEVRIDALTQNRAHIRRGERQDLRDKSGVKEGVC